MLCATTCMFCESPKELFINCSRYHGTCFNHCQTTEPFYRCTHCNSVTPILGQTCSECQYSNIFSVTSSSTSLCLACYNKKEQITPCHYCQSTQEALTPLICGHKLCQNCFYANYRQCPLCGTANYCIKCESNEELRVIECYHTVCNGCYQLNSFTCPFCFPPEVHYTLFCSQCNKGVYQFGCPHEICETCLGLGNECKMCVEERVAAEENKNKEMLSSVELRNNDEEKKAENSDLGNNDKEIKYQEEEFKDNDEEKKVKNEDLGNSDKKIKDKKQEPRDNGEGSFSIKVENEGDMGAEQINIWGAGKKEDHGFVDITEETRLKDEDDDKEEGSCQFCTLAFLLILFYLATFCFCFSCCFNCFSGFTTNKRLSENLYLFCLCKSKSLTRKIWRQILRFECPNREVDKSN